MTGEAMTKGYNEYTEHLKSSAVPSLGLLCWYSVPESSEVTHKEFMVTITTSDAPIKPPEVPKLGDVFRRACNTSKILKVPSAVEGEFYNYTMRDASYDDTFIFRTFVEELVDAKNHSLSFRSTAIFSKDTGNVTCDFEYDDDDPGTIVAKQMEVHVNGYLKRQADMLPAIQIREAARKAVEQQLRGTRVRPGGGVYFITMDKATQLEAVEYVINSVKDASFHILPLVDDTKQREMLKSSFEDESLEETRRLSEEIAELLRSGKDIPAKKFMDLNDRFQIQKTKLAEYQVLLSDTLGTSNTAIDMVNTQLINLLDKAS
jgi:hypothetical protein